MPINILAEALNDAFESYLKTHPWLREKIRPGGNRRAFVFGTYTPDDLHGQILWQGPAYSNAATNCVIRLNARSSPVNIVVTGCHEMAHLIYDDHSTKHSDLTMALLGQLVLGKYTEQLKQLNIVH